MNLLNKSNKDQLIFSVKNVNFNTNNFDLIRLFAAIQVALHHSLAHLKLDHILWIKSASYIIDMFPGVPIFFFISGFLISRSYEKNNDIIKYSKNRFLRLFPGLIICGIASIILIHLSGYLSTQDIDIKKRIAWIISQITFFQFYDPVFLKGYGIGSANGSLWTVFIEIQFYFFIPVMYLPLGKSVRKNKTFNRCIVLTILLFLFIHVVYYANKHSAMLIFRILKITFAPYIYMFLVGVFFQRNFDFIHKLLSGNFLITASVYMLTYAISNHFFNITVGNNLEPWLFLLLCCTIFSCAFSYRTISDRLLNKNDISYGLYIYHMPIINFFIYNGWINKMYYLPIVASITFIFSVLSFHLIEKPCMKMKANPLKPL